MPGLSLVRRKDLLRLLHDACEQNLSVRISIVSGEGAGRTGATRLLALRPDSVLLYWPSGKMSHAAVAGTRVAVYFEYSGERYGFDCVSQGRLEHRFNHGGKAVALRVSLPLRLDVKQQRSNYRVPLIGKDRIDLTLTRAADESLRLSAIVRDLSRVGLGGAAAWSDLRRHRVGELFLSEFTLPGVDRPFAVYARLAHLREAAEDKGVFGLAFCGGEDQAAQEDQLHRLERYVAQRERAQLGRAGTL